jgi:hypothetical protein
MIFRTNQIRTLLVVARVEDGHPVEFVSPIVAQLTCVSLLEGRVVQLPILRYELLRRDYTVQCDVHSQEIRLGEMLSWERTDRFIT